MGMGNTVIKLVTKLLKNKNVSGDCITFGVQGIEGQYHDILKIIKCENYPYSNVPEAEIINDPLTQFGDSIHQSILFKLLGYNKIDSIDYYENENPTHIADLNQPIENNLIDKYNLVYDGGTTEHCFNVFQVMANAIKLLKIGGSVIHQLPMSGYVNHGFYQFSPTFFFDFYEANGFEDFECKIHVRSPVFKKAYYLDYTPGNYLPSSFGASQADILFFATKKTDKNIVVVPNQTCYSETLENNILDSDKISIRSYMIKLLKPLPVLYNLSSYLYSIYMKKHIKKHKL